MKSHPNIVDAIQQISRARSFDDAWDALSKGTEQLEVKLGSYAFGFRVDKTLDGVACSTLPIQSEGVTKLAYATDFMDFYDGGGFFEYDTTVLWAGRHSRPALWTEIDRPIANGKWGGKFAELYHTTRDFGLKNGAVIPLRKRSDLALGGVVVVTDSELKPEQADRLLTERMPALQQLAEAFHLYRPICELTSAKIGLSRREKECLHYLSQGLGHKQISYLLKTHDRTVQKQIASAKKKLSAETATQAVVKALAYELIAP